MAHTYDLTTNIGKVRLLIGDTDIVPITDAQFSDEEIQVFLDMGGTILTAAGYALEAWASAITDSVLSEKIGDYSYTKKDADTKRALAAEYKKEDAAKPYFTWSELDLTGIDSTISEDVE